MQKVDEQEECWGRRKAEHGYKRLLSARHLAERGIARAASQLGVCQGDELCLSKLLINDNNYT